jgi:hypothetical protein
VTSFSKNNYFQKHFSIIRNQEIDYPKIENGFIKKYNDVENNHFYGVISDAETVETD